MTKELTEDQYKSTFGEKMFDVTESAEPVLDIWEYIEQLTIDNIVLKYVLEKQLVEKVYRNALNTFEHILFPTDNTNIFIVLVVDIKEKIIYGHFKLDLEKEYQTKET